MMKFKTKNYTFQYSKGSLAEKDIKKIANVQENAYRKIHEILGEETHLSLKYFLYNSPEEVGEAYGDSEPCNGFVRIPNEIHAVYNESTKCIGEHEDSHLISYKLFEKPKNAFLREGFAEYFCDFWKNRKHNEWVKDFLKNGEYICVCDLMKNEMFFSKTEIDGGLITYPIAGAFVKFLIEHYGLEKFKKLFRENEGLEEIYGGKCFEIEKLFKKSLEK